MHIVQSAYRRCLRRSSAANDDLARAFWTAGTGPIPMMRGSTPATAAVTTRACGVRPWRLTACSLATIKAHAPSLMPAEFPAVTLPSARTTPLRVESRARVVSGPLSPQVAHGRTVTELHARATNNENAELAKRLAPRFALVRRVAAALLLVLERLHVGDVLRSPGGALVLDERAATDHGDLATVETEAFTVRDGFGKGDAVGAIDDVDPPWWNAELQSRKSSKSSIMRGIAERSALESRRARCGDWPYQRG
jgi:hypothetical protein